MFTSVMGQLIRGSGKGGIGMGLGSRGMWMERFMRGGGWRGSLWKGGFSTWVGGVMRVVG